MNNFLFLAFFACLSPSFAVPVEEELISIEVQKAPSLTKAEQELPCGEHGNGQVGDMLERETRNAMTNRIFLWPNGTMYYSISNNYTSTERNKILQAMREIENDVNSQGFQCIRFQPRTTETDYVFIYKGRGCHSKVGFQHQGQQHMSIGQRCGEIKGIIIHELLHSLGFFHEHKRFDRDTYVTMNDSNIASNYRCEFAKLPSTSIDLLGVDYSFDSIMHYGPYALAADRSKPVIQPKPGKFNVDVRMGQRLGLSSSDVKKIQLLYSCPVDTAYVPRFKKEMIYECHFENISSSLRNETDEFCWTLLQGGTSPGPQSGNTNDTEMLNECDFENSSSSLRNETGEFCWTLHQGATSTGPQAGNTNGADQYFVATADGHHGQRARFTTPPHDQGTFCLEYFYFQKNSTSYFNFLASGDHFHNLLLFSTREESYNEWMNERLTIPLPVGSSIQITFEAVIDRHDVAIDDLIMYKGMCV